MPDSIDFYKGFLLHVIPVRIIVPWIDLETREPATSIIMNMHFSKNLITILISLQGLPAKLFPATASWALWKVF